MEIELYEPSLLSQKFAHFKIKDFNLHVQAGDFKILVDRVEGKKDRIIIRWPNTNVFGPDYRFISFLIMEMFHGTQDHEIIVRGIYPCGLEITTR